MGDKSRLANPFSRSIILASSRGSLRLPVITLCTLLHSLLVSTSLTTSPLRKLYGTGNLHPPEITVVVPICTLSDCRTPPRLAVTTDSFSRHSLCHRLLDSVSRPDPALRPSAASSANLPISTPPTPVRAEKISRHHPIPPSSGSDRQYGSGDYYFSHPPGYPGGHCASQHHITHLGNLLFTFHPSLHTYHILYRLYIILSLDGFGRRTGDKIERPHTPTIAFRQTGRSADTASPCPGPGPDPHHRGASDKMASMDDLVATVSGTHVSQDHYDLQNFRVSFRCDDNNGQAGADVSSIELPGSNDGLAPSIPIGLPPTIPIDIDHSQVAARHHPILWLRVQSTVSVTFGPPELI